MTDINAWAFDSNGIAEHSDLLAKGSSDGNKVSDTEPCQPVIGYQDVVEILRLQEDNANLIKINFNLEQHVSAYKEDIEKLEEINEGLAEENEAYQARVESLEYEVWELKDALEKIQSAVERVMA